MTKPSLEDLGLDLLTTSVAERARCLLLPFLTVIGFFWAGERGHWWAALLLAVIQSFFTYASVSHDLVHRTLRLPAWLNESLLCLIEASNFRSGHAFRVTHYHHHQRFPAADDLEGAASGMPWWRALMEGVIAQPKLWVWAWKNSRGTMRLWLALEAVMVSAFLAWCLTSSVGRIYAAVIIAGSWIFPFMTGYMPHHAQGETPLQQTRLFRGKVLSLLTFEHLYHLEHHLYPQVPHQRWPELARRLDPYFSSQGIQPTVLWR